MFIKTSKMRVKNFITKHILQVIKKRRLKIISNILKLNLITLRRYIGLLLFIFQLPEMTCSVKYFRACKWIVRLGIIINNFFFVIYAKYLKVMIRKKGTKCYCVVGCHGESCKFNKMN